MPEFMTIKMKESEKARFRSWLNGLSKENQTECKKIVVDTLHGIRRKAMMLAPVNKQIGQGPFLSRQIHVILNSDRLGGMVHTQVKYAPYQEWGTGKFVKVPAFVKTMFGVDSRQWKSPRKHNHNMKPQPYFFEPARVGVNEMVVKIKNMGFKEK